MNLYDVNAKYQNLMYLIDQEEVSEEALLNALEDVEDEFVEQCESIAKILKNIKADELALKEEQKRLKEKRDKLNYRYEWLREHLKQSMLLTGNTKFKQGIFSFNIQQSKQIEIEDVEKIPDLFKEQQPPKINKNDIKRFLKETGEPVPGAKLKVKDIVVIR